MNIGTYFDYNHHITFINTYTHERHLSPHKQKQIVLYLSLVVSKLSRDRTNIFAVKIISQS